MVTARPINNDTVMEETEFWANYGFEKDDIGNWIIPGFAFGADVNIRVQVTPWGVIVADVIGIIEVIEKKNREDSAKVWRERLADKQGIIQEDLTPDEGMKNHNILLYNYKLSHRSNLRTYQEIFPGQV